MFKEFDELKPLYWENLPNFGLYADQLLHYVHEALKCYFSNEFLTANMLHNYCKNGIIPKPIGKKYFKEHLAHVIIICILKPLLPIAQIKEGIELQKNIMGIERAYDEFINILQNTMQNIKKHYKINEPYVFEGFEAKPSNLSLTFAVHAFCFQALTHKIIAMKGLYQNHDKNEQDCDINGFGK